jgi:hypothetical protein
MCSIASEISVRTGAARTDSFSPSDGSFASGFTFCPLRRQIVKYAVTATTRFSAVDNAAAPLQASNASIAIHAQSTEATSNRNLTRSRIYFLEQHDSGQTHFGIAVQRQLVWRCLKTISGAQFWTAGCQHYESGADVLLRGGSPDPTGHTVTLRLRPDAALTRPL